MTGAAWAMLAITWSVIGFFTIYFFLRVLAAGRRGRGDEGAGEDVRSAVSRRSPRGGR